eukprot:498007-Rhodomonas_salina.1
MGTRVPAEVPRVPRSVFPGRNSYAPGTLGTRSTRQYPGMHFREPSTRVPGVPPGDRIPSFQDF